MRPIINGTTRPLRKRWRTNYDPSRGITFTQEFESAGDGLGGLANAFRSERIAYDHQTDGVRSSLVATSSGQATGFEETPIDTWQLLCNEIQKDIKEHPSVLAMEIATPGTLHSVLEAVRQYEDTGAADIEPEWFTDATTAARLFRALIHGQTSYPIGQYVLRHTTNVSNVYDTNVADLGVEYIYSTSQLISEIANHAYWLFPCPGRLILKIERMENQISAAAGSDLIWGWRKLPSQETTAASNRIDISTEYWLAGWSSLTNAAL